MIVGGSGVVLRTVGGGVTWSEEAGPTANFPLSLSYVGPQHTWAVGTSGTIVRLQGAASTGTAIEEFPGAERPSRVALDQNYPNPFRESTTIRFTLEDPGPVRLEVFDLPGRRVACLADEPMSEGGHEVTWRASQFPPGVYLYRLEVSRHVSARSTVLSR